MLSRAYVVFVAGSPFLIGACPDDPPAMSAAVLEAEPVRASLVVDPSHPDQTAGSDIVIAASCSGELAAASDLTIDAVAIVGNDAAGGEKRTVLTPITLQRFPEALTLAPHAAPVLVGVGMSGIAAQNTRLGFVCGLTAPRLEVVVSACGATDTVLVPVNVRCYPDRRHPEILALKDAGTPPNKPCARVGTSTVANTEVAYRMGYDAAGRHLFTDLDDVFAERRAYQYDANGRVIGYYDMDLESGLAIYQATYTYDAMGRRATAEVELEPTEFDVESDWRTRYSYDYATADDQGWTEQRDGAIVATGAWDPAKGELTTTRTVDDSSEQFAAFGTPFLREAWINASDVDRLFLLQPGLATRFQGTTKVLDRKIAWSDGRITSDVSTANGATFTTTWQYACDD